MTREENECLVALREKSYHGLNIIEASRLGELERKKEIDESDWKVDAEGSMTHEKPYYFIEASRLGENWLEHMSNKGWVNLDTFVRAYIRACYIARVNTVQITY